MKVEKKLNDVVNRLNKTKEQRKPDLQAEREERDRQDRVEKRRLEEQKVGKSVREKVTVDGSGVQNEVRTEKRVIEARGISKERALYANASPTLYI